jgi:hypothetical protein
MFGVAEASDQGQDVETELVVRQGEEGLGFRAVGSVVARAVRVGTAADVQGEAFDRVEGGDGASVGVGGPEDVTAFQAVRGYRSERLSLGGTRSATSACHDLHLLADLPSLF